MRRSHWTPSIIPGDQRSNCLSCSGRFRKIRLRLARADYEATDLEAVIEDLLSGQYNNPKVPLGGN